MDNSIILGLLALVFSPVMFAQQQSATELKVGDPAVDFSLPYATKDSVGNGKLQLSSLFGKKNIVLAFYPADWSGGCTKEVCTLRDNFAALGDLNAEVLGISGDFQYSHYEWAKHHNLPFTLVSDHKQDIARAYNSYNPETGFDKRTVFVIDKQGKIAYIDLHYTVADMNSFNKLKETLEKLK